MKKRTDSCSEAQGLAERLMILEVSKSLGVNLSPQEIPFGSATVNVDGFHKTDCLVIFAEAWAHIGRAKPAQVNKIRGDMLKLALVRRILARSYPSIEIRCFLVFADDAAAACVRSKRSWLAIAASEFGVEPMVVRLNPEVIQTISDAQQRQDLRWMPTQAAE